MLGAGASRGVSYARPNSFPSPLDSDFFVLLPRLGPGKYSDAVSRVQGWRRELPTDSRDSMERAFYTLQSRAYFLEKLVPHEVPDPKDELVVSSFATCITALLREAHGTNKCKYHEKLFRQISAGGTIISFNYDLVVERALLSRGVGSNLFGPWLYGLEGAPAGFDLPTVLKLHGSQNWQIEDENIEVRTKEWAGLSSPGYRGDVGVGTVFPIFLPFWDKRIERDPWLKFWTLAFARLATAESVVVWGYSLPTTDLKAQQLFKSALKDRPFNLCVVDPSPDTRERWRRLFPEALYWEYQAIGEFLDYPPAWWTAPVSP